MDTMLIQVMLLVALEAMVLLIECRLVMLAYSGLIFLDSSKRWLERMEPAITKLHYLASSSGKKQVLAERMQSMCKV